MARSRKEIIALMTAVDKVESHAEFVEGGSASVLIVDDRPTSRALLKAVLEQQNYAITEAVGGRDAVALIAKRTFDLVVLDIVMPDLNGIEVLKQIRAQFAEIELPVIMVTVKHDIEDVVQALELGANDYVTKPIDYAILIARIRTQLSRKQAVSALQEARAGLEQRIAERTAEFVQANEALQSEIAERHQAEQALRASEARFRTFYDFTPSMFFTISSDGVIESVNSFGATQLGYTVDELVGLSAAGIHDDDKQYQEYFNACVGAPDKVHRWELGVIKKNGSLMWVRESGRVVDALDGHTHVLVACEDMTEARRLSEKLTYQATHDALTGLFNRGEFERRLRTVLERASEQGGAYALLYMDLDQFKVINDTCGHIAGDELLKRLGRWLTMGMAAQDTLARLGGDEFGIVLEDCTIDRAKQVADSLRRKIEEFRFVWEGKVLSIGVSVGLVPINATSGSITDVLSAADAACYLAKDEGRNRIHVYREDDHQLAHRMGEMEWVAEISRALEEQRFHLHYQPIASLNGQRGHHYELLLRMQNEDGDQILPGMFLPAAERYNLATRIDSWFIERAFEWLADHPDHVRELYLCAINVSGQSLGDKEFQEFLFALFDKTRIPPEKICFEITETTAIANLPNTARFIETIKSRRKCRFALDDFGIGLSSFAYLRALPIDYIKIDGAFVKGVDSDPVNFAIVKSINDVAKVMGKKTVAEYVENRHTLEKLRDIGVDYAQGDIIGASGPIQTMMDSPPVKVASTEI